MHLGYTSRIDENMNERHAGGCMLYSLTSSHGCGASPCNYVRELHASYN